jgi:hypothetical protein
MRRAACFCFLFLLVHVFMSLHSQGQASLIEIKGTVYDITQRNALEGVTVMATNGRGTQTDSMGHYSILARLSDSVFFSYQNKVTGKYPVASIADPQQFSMALHVHTHQLPMVTVYAKRYQDDSAAFREAYGKYMNYSKPNPLSSVNVANGGVGMDPNEIINMFRFKRNRQLAALSARLVEEEQSKYVDFRYNRKFVRKVTGLDGISLDRFMYKYRPPYDFVRIVNDLELGYYIQQCYKKEIGQLPAGVEIYLLGIDPLEREYRRN